ncbi:uncharacterized protein LOC124806427 isoform X1 [Hydra vulgaris]|uniref:uncharacterized protein LOC124806427 isoform X1 n=1 Tax=Hydra vulgaris TaxID=6087 RepID=UPI001F5FD5E2|nr:uncharacterized protein LOC124806427 [Hydra vulgaris]
MDVIQFNSIVKNLKSIINNCEEKFYFVEKEKNISLISYEHCGPVPKFSIFITLEDSGDIYFTGYSQLLQIKLSFLNKGVIKYYSQLENAVSYVINNETDSKRASYIRHQVALLNKTNNTPFSLEDISDALHLYSKSRSVYFDLVEKLVLPSVRELQRMTNKINKLEDTEYLKMIFKELQEFQKYCFILADEVYIKPGLRYSGGIVYGEAENIQEKAKTVLALMLLCLFGGPRLVIKVFPVCKVTTNFQTSVIEELNQQIIIAGGKPLGLIMDNCRVNQKTFQYFNAKKVPAYYLLNDTVHILKCIQNNWITEKLQCLKYRLLNDNDTVRLAEWKFIIQLHAADSGIFKLSPLTQKAVSPKPIERQNVGLVLKVFCDETVAALRVKFPEAEDTALFIETVVKWWLIVNSKAKGLDIRLNDIRRKPITSVNDWQIDFLENHISYFAENLKCVYSKLREKKLTMDTASALQKTSKRLASCAKYLLNCGVSYVLLGHMQSDALEKQFGKYRQGSGGISDNCAK